MRAIEYVHQGLALDTGLTGHRHRRAPRPPACVQRLRVQSPARLRNARVAVG
jgi:hypothetical protein